MEKQQYIFASFLSLIIVLDIVSFALCVAAEFKRSKKEDLRFDGKFCYLPKSLAFGLGIKALICLVISQIIGSFLICRKFLIGSNCKAEKSTLSIIFLVFSWISFGVAVILLSVATSMNQTQHLGEGWLDSECYVVKDGVYVGSAVLILVTLTSVLYSVAVPIRKREVEQCKKVHAHVQVE